MNTLKGYLQLNHDPASKVTEVIVRTQLSAFLIWLPWIHPQPQLLLPNLSLTRTYHPRDLNKLLPTERAIWIRRSWIKVDWVTKMREIWITKKKRWFSKGKSWTSILFRNPQSSGRVWRKNINKVKGIVRSLKRAIPRMKIRHIGLKLSWITYWKRRDRKSYITITVITRKLSPMWRNHCKCSVW